jgi:hypothetical protein
MEFVMEEVAVGQVFLQALQLSLPTLFHQLLSLY